VGVTASSNTSPSPVCASNFELSFGRNAFRHNKPRTRIELLESSSSVRRGGMKRFQDCCTISFDAFSTAHWKTVTEYGAEHFQGLDERSNSAVSKLLGGKEEGIAFRPVEVMAVGLEAEKRGRMMVWRR
jgi:hypothetical protein